MSFNINILYKLIDEGKYVQSIQWLQNVQQQNPQFIDNQLFNSLKAYCQIQTGKQGDTLVTLNYQQQQPQDQNFLVFSQTDGLLYQFNNIIGWNTEGLTPPFLTKIYYLYAATCLFNRRFDILRTKDKVQIVQGKERDNLSQYSRDIFLQLLENNKIDYEQLIQLLNQFIQLTLDNKVYKMQGQRLNRQHAFSIIHNIIHFIAIQAPQLLEKVTDLETINEIIIKQLNFRLYVFIKHKFETFEALLRHLLSCLAEQELPDGEVGQYLLRYYKEVQQLSDAPTLIESVSKHTEYSFMLKLIITKQIDVNYKFENNINNLVLVHELFKTGALGEEEVQKLDHYFHSIIHDTFQQINESSVKQFIEQNNNDIGKIIECGCKVANTTDLISNQEIFQYFKAFEEQLENYYYVAYRLKLNTPQEFLRNIQVSNYLYLTAIPLAIKGYLKESYETFKQRNGYSNEESFYQTNAFCHIRLQNHTETQLWEIQNVIQANCLMMSNILYQNFNYIYESLVETCNITTSCRLYETKPLMQNVCSYYCSTIYTAFQINNVLQDIINNKSNSKIISTDNLLFYFNGTLGKISGNNIDSFKLLYNFDNVLDLIDTKTQYFMSNSEYESELRQNNLQIIKDTLKDFIQEPINRKKAPKQMIYTNLLNRESFYYKYLYEQPQINKIQYIDMKVFIYHALFKLMYVKLTTNGKDFEQKFVSLVFKVYQLGKQNRSFTENEEVVIQAIINYMQKIEIDLFKELEKISIKTVGDFIEEYTILRAFALLQIHLKA